MTATSLLATTRTADPEVMRAWRTGPRWYYVVVALIEGSGTAAVQLRRDRVARALGDVVRPTTPHQPHVTVQAVGFQPIAWQEQQVELSVGGADTFTTAAYLSVHSRELLRLRATLPAAPGHGAAADQETSDGEIGQQGWGAGSAAGREHLGNPSDYVPHVTVGTYERVCALTEIQRRLRSLAHAQPIPVRAVVRLMAVDTRCPASSLHPVAGS